MGFPKRYDGELRETLFMSQGSQVSMRMAMGFKFYFIFKLYITVLVSCLYSCLENPMDRGARWATVHGVAESETT